MSTTDHRAAGRIDDALLAALRARLPDYLTALGVELRRNGTRLVGKCPVHEDRDPSFAVFGQHQETCGCHPCGFTGDVFATSVWLGRSSSFREAVADVASVLGVHIPDVAPHSPRPAPARIPKAPAPPFTLSDADRRKIYDARLAWSDAFHSGDPIVDRIAESLGFDRETLRVASWGNCGLGLANGWLCYRYPQGLKWRNPDSTAKPRFRWLVGKATCPWRWEWVRPHTRTVYLPQVS